MFKYYVTKLAGRGEFSMKHFSQRNFHDFSVQQERGGAKFIGTLIYECPLLPTPIVDSMKNDANEIFEYFKEEINIYTLIEFHLFVKHS